MKNPLANLVSRVSARLGRAKEPQARELVVRTGPNTVIVKSNPADGAISVPQTQRYLGLIFESNSGAWQSNVTLDRNDALMQYSPIWACTTGIANDVSKLRVKLMRVADIKGRQLWKEDIQNSPFAQVIRRPNHFQNRIQFIRQWMLSKLIYGNTIVLKERDGRGLVVRKYVLDYTRVTPLVAHRGDVYYKLAVDNISGLEEALVVPASEIIHDRWNCLWHPLIGISPLYACAMSGTQGNRIQANSSLFFQNMSRPSGALTAPGAISNETADRLKASWETNFSGGNIGRVAVLGDGLTYEPMSVPAEQSQLVEQLNWTVADVARAYHYPLHKLTGVLPANQNVEATNLEYYTACLQTLIEDAELCIDEGIGLPADLRTEFDLDGLLRMDSAGRNEKHNKAIAAGWKAPNEARIEENYEPVEGGDTPYLQQQNYSLAALSKRDQKEDPFATAAPKAATPPATAPAATAANDAVAAEADELLIKLLHDATA